MRFVAIISSQRNSPYASRIRISNGSDVAPRSRSRSERNTPATTATSSWCTIPDDAKLTPTSKPEKRAVDGLRYLISPLPP